MNIIHLKRKYILPLKWIFQANIRLFSLILNNFVCFPSFWVRFYKQDWMIIHLTMDNMRCIMHTFQKEAATFRELKKEIL